VDGDVSARGITIVVVSDEDVANRGYVDASAVWFVCFFGPFAEEFIPFVKSMFFLLVTVLDIPIAIAFQFSPPLEEVVARGTADLTKGILGEFGFLLLG
jgi:hypothetical protein